MQRPLPTMKQVHVRNIFQLFVPISADVSSGFSFKQSPTPSFGITLTREETNEYYHYEIQLKISDETETLRNDVFIWAKRNALRLVTTPNTKNIETMVLSLKIDEKAIRFGNLRSKRIRFVINFFNAGIFGKHGVSEECVLLPRRRFREDSEDVPSIPILWSEYIHSDEDCQRSSGDDWSPQDAEDSVMFAIDQENSPHEHTSSFNSVSNNNEYSDSEQYMVLYNGNAEVVGNFRALNFYKASDINLKEDIRLLVEDQDCRQALLKIDGVEYKFKDGVSHTTNKRFIGYIAQQIESVIPAAVQLIDGILHVDYESLIPYLSESIKQNFSDINGLHSRTDRIEQLVNLMYAEFVRKDQKRNNELHKKPKSTPINSRIGKPKLWWWIIGILLVVTAMTAGALGIFFAYNNNNNVVPPTGPDHSPLDPKSPVTLPFISVPLPSGLEVNTSRTDISILEEFYNATGGPNWVTGHINGSPWMSSASKCAWKGIGCDRNQQVIVIISLTDCNLRGTIPEAIGELNLESLDLSGNSLYGTIPATIGNITTLVSLSLNENNLTGIIPPSFSQLKHLKILHLNGNNFTEYMFPMMIIEMPSLFNLNLSKTNLFGPIPDSLMNHPALSTLALRENKLSGTLPAFGPELLKLDLSFNQLEGTLKPLLSPHNAMHVLDLHNNKLNGTINNIILLDLRTLDLSNNQFSGEFSSSSRILEYVDISGNHFTSVDSEKLRYLSIISACNMAHNDWKCPIAFWVTDRCHGGECTNEV